MAHDPLINTLGLVNRLDFNQQAGGRCHLLPSVANRVEAPSLNVPGSKLIIFGMVIPPLIGNPYNGYINPYYWVDDHPYHRKTMGV